MGGSRLQTTGRQHLADKTNTPLLGMPYAYALRLTGEAPPHDSHLGKSRAASAARRPIAGWPSWAQLSDRHHHYASEHITTLATRNETDRHDTQTEHTHSKPPPPRPSSLVLSRTLGSHDLPTARTRPQRPDSEGEEEEEKTS
eukprot:scaffold33136_cov33-Tisochrysis_lutea.AAC.1